MQVRNDSGDVIPAFAAMRVTGVVEVKKETVFTVDQQDTSDAPVLINGPTPIAVWDEDHPDYGVAQPGPIVAAYFDTADSPAVGDELGPEDGEWKLTAAGSGWVYLGALADENVGLFQASGGGVLFENSITDEAIGKGGVGTVSIQDVASDGTETDTGRNVEARNRYADVAVGKKVGLVRKNGVWFLIAAECE
jgi:hypothetical protein